MELGVTLLDRADTYGNGHNEELLGKALAELRELSLPSLGSDQFAYEMLPPIG
jgi:diketogulonate reductase-like aldo/keto reductase